MYQKKLSVFSCFLAALSSLHCGTTSDSNATVISSSVQSLLSPADESKVAIFQSQKELAADIDDNEVRAMVRNAVELAGGLANVVHDGDVVVLKPNLVLTTDMTLPGSRGVPLPPTANGVTTDYRVTKAAVELVRERNPSGKVYVMEGSAVSTSGAFAHHKYTKEMIPGVDDFIAIEEQSGAWQDEKSAQLSKLSKDGTLLQPEYYYNRIYAEANVVISLPTLKNHWISVISGAIKNVSVGATPANIYGRAPNDPNRAGIRHATLAFHQFMHDYFFLRPVNFVIMDGIQGVQNGPTPSWANSRSDSLAKEQMNMRLIVAGQDAVAVDTVESLLMGWDPNSVEYLKMLENSKMGHLKSSLIRVVGQKVDQTRKQFAGNTGAFAYGGAKITDTTPPAFRVGSSTFQGDRAHIALQGYDQDLNRVEVSIGSTSLPAVAAGFGNLEFDISSVPAGVHNVVIDGYDVYKNRTTVIIPQTFAKPQSNP